MQDAQWKKILSVLDGTNDAVPFGVIVDSPWIPGYCGIGTVDFFLRQEAWKDAYDKIHRDFPDLIYLPDHWVEFGMATEVSGFGARMDFFDHTLPDAHPLFADADDAAERIDELAMPDPEKNGLMPFVLNLQRYLRPTLEQEGDRARMVCCRGPFTIGSYLLGVPEFLVFAKVYPEEFHRFADRCTDFLIRWLNAQLDAVGGADSVMVLDDVCGFFSPADFEELAFPYLKRIFDAFPNHIHFFHNDMTTDTAARFVEKMGVDVFNTTYVFSLAHLRKLMGEKVTLLGCFEPMLLTEDDPNLAVRDVKRVLDEYRAACGNCKKLILSPGGGMPIGAKAAPLAAILDYLKENGGV